MSMVAMIHEAQSSGEDIRQIVDKMLYVLQNDTRADAIMACLTLAILLQKEDLTSEEIQEGVMGASQWIVMYLGETPELDGKKVLN